MRRAVAKKAFPNQEYAIIDQIVAKGEFGWTSNQNRQHSERLRGFGSGF